MRNRFGKLLAALLPLIVILSTSAFAASYTATMSGHFNTNSTWGGSGHPGAGDTFTIPSGITVTCDSTDGACASGTAASQTCTVDGTVTGALVIGNGGTLTHAGELDIDHNASLTITAATATATLVIKPGSGATCTLNFDNDNGTNAAQWNMTGASTSVRAIVEGDMSGGGTAFVIASPAGGTMPTISFTHATISNCGTGSLTCGNGYAFNVSGPATIADLDVINTAGFDVTFPANGTTNITETALSFVNPVGSDVGKWVDSTAPTTAQRTFQNITCYLDTALSAAQTNPPQFTLEVSGAQCGLSTNSGDPGDAACFVAYNCTISHGDPTAGANMIDRESWIIVDGQQNHLTPGVLLEGIAADDQQFQDGIVYTHWENAHPWLSVINTGGTANQYNYNICDGDGFAHGDTGNMFEDNGNHFATYNLNINGCGELDSDEGSTTAFNDINNTTYHSYGVSLGNSNVQYSPLVIDNNLFIYPYDPFSPPQEGNFQTGLTVQAAMPRQNATNFPDYNGYYGMQGSGDSDPVSGPATSCGHGGPPVVPCPLPNATDGTTVSYVGVPAIYLSGLSSCATANGTTSTIVVFSSCSTGSMRAGDFAVDQAGTKPFATVASILNRSTFTLTPPGISGLTSGHVLLIAPSYWSTSGVLYGTTSGYGTHDIHADPDFVDSTRNNCTYYTRVGGGTAPCGPWTGAVAGGFFVSTSTSGTTMIDDTTPGIDFITLGITANNDWLNIYQGNSTTWRCTALVTAVAQTQLTISPPCQGLSSGDAFSFITATRYLGRAVVALNGTDYQGNPTTPVPWATTLQAWLWIRQGFRPQNLVYKGAGNNGSDLGAVPLQPLHPLTTGGWQ